MITHSDEGPEFDPDDPLAVILRPGSDYLGPPVGRYETIRRRASRRRLLRATVGAGAVCAVAVLVALPLRLAGPETPTTPTVPMAPPRTPDSSAPPTPSPTRDPVTTEPTRASSDAIPATSPGSTTVDRTPASTPTPQPTEASASATQASEAPDTADTADISATPDASGRDRE